MGWHYLLLPEIRAMSIFVVKKEANQPPQTTPGGCAPLRV